MHGRFPEREAGWGTPPYEQLAAEGCGLSRPGDRAKAVTWCPADSRRSTTQRPSGPVAPKTSTFMTVYLQPIANPAQASTNPMSSNQERSPWKNSHRLRTDFQFSGGCSGSQRPVARLMGTLKITVEVSAAM